MMWLVCNTTALVLLLWMSATAATAAKQLSNLPDFATLKTNHIYFFPLETEECGIGTRMFYGVVVPEKITSPNKFFMESMGGAICFDKHSCLDEEFSVWLDLFRIFFRYGKGGVPEGTDFKLFFQVLTSGFPIELDGNIGFRGFNAAWLPNGVGKPLEGQVGIYYPSCTGDAGLGNYKVKYTSNMTVRHTGGVGFMMLLEAIKKKHSNIERMTLIGASGTAVSRVAWAPTVADMLPTTEILVVADSAMHVLPNTSVFKYFWSEVQWSPNPNGRHDHATLYAPNVNSLPKFDWRNVSAISDMLRRYNGRVKLLYLGCINDKVVVQDRVTLAKYAGLSVAASFQSGEQEVAQETWNFLNRLKREAPADCAFSYISEGDCHHQTRNGFMLPINDADPSDLGPEEFTKAFLTGNPSPAHRWCCDGEKKETSSEKTETASADSSMPSLVALALALAAAWASFTTEPLTSTHE